MPKPSEPLLRAARATDAEAIARVMRAAFLSFGWMPMLHTPEGDLLFIKDVLSQKRVIVAEADNELIGFIAVGGEWVEQLYLDPRWTGKGIGSRLLDEAIATLPVVRLYCFQANSGARRFYERHGFRAELFGDGSKNQEGLPDILYVRSVAAASPGA